jgi:uncharacterized DUF497 family protein
MYNIKVAFEWDPDKAEANFRRHGMMFSTDPKACSATIFAITISDNESDPAERRFVTLGLGTKG